MSVKKPITSSSSTPSNGTATPPKYSVHVALQHLYRAQQYQKH